LSVQHFVLGKRKNEKGGLRVPTDKAVTTDSYKKYGLFVTIGKPLATFISQDKSTNSFLLRKKPICDEQIGFFHLVA
jgi:hypothetical protein